MNLTRSICLLWPALMVSALVLWRKPDPRQSGAALAASLWVIAALPVLGPLADWLGFWRFEPGGATLLGVPVELVLGWALLWGALPVLAFPRTPVPVLILCAGGFDLLAMPLCQPVVRLGPDWQLGELCTLALVFLPAATLGRSIVQKQRLVLRAVLAAIGYAGLHYWVLPALILEQTGGTWTRALGWSREAQGFFLQAAFLLAVPGLSATQEFVVRGMGTPFPFDPTRRLVTSGPYAYVSNPMQVSTLLLFLLWGLWTGSLWVAAAGGVELVAAAGVAAWHEHTQLLPRYGDAWSVYRAQVRFWIPRWRPRIAFTARLYVAADCELCTSVGRWFTDRSGVGLEILPAHTHTAHPLRRMRYEAPGFSEDGLAAFARALEHLHLGWAFVGWTLRLPVLSELAQWLVDISGGGPRPAQ